MADEQLETESALDLAAIGEEESNYDDLFEEAPKGGTSETQEEEVQLDDDGNPIELDDLFEKAEPDKDSTKDSIKDDAASKDDNPAEKESEYKPGDYISKLNEDYELGLHMENLPEGLTPEAELDLAREIIDKRRVANEDQIKALSSYDQLINADPETQRYLQDRANGMTMKDMVAKYGTSAQYADEESQLQEFMRDAYGLNDDQIAAGIAQMKEAGTYESQVQTIIDKNLAKESAAQTAAEEQRHAEVLAQQNAWAEYTDSVSQQLKETDSFGEFKVNDNIRKELLNDATKLDNNGYTKIELDVQSPENSVKAAFALRYWDQFVQATAKGHFNTGKASVYDLLATDPAELQGSSGRQSSNRSEGVNEQLAGQF